jgi:predicted ATP-dependent endonuclease of OLD family
MGIISKEIKISNNSFSFQNNNDKSNVLNGLSKVNIFVGENNSGKSLFMRSLIKDLNFKFIPFNDEIKIGSDILTKAKMLGLETPKKDIIKNINVDIHSFKNDFEVLCKKHSNVTSIFSRFQKLVNEIELIEFLSPNKDDYFIKFFKYRDAAYNLSQEKGASTNYVQHNILGNELLEVYTKNFNHWPIKAINLTFDFHKIYIPILRGLRPLNNSVDAYTAKTIEDYFFDTITGLTNTTKILMQNKIQISSGLNFYQIIKRHLLGNLSQRRLVEKFEDYLSKQFFDGEIVTLIPKEGDSVLSVKIGSEKEKHIHELGDGIQSIIIITLPLFLSLDKIRPKENILVFIEEPEHLLHPSLQRKLIETFYDEIFEDYQFFFTTHSNHFLDTALDFDEVSIFSFEKIIEGNNDEEDPHFIIKPSKIGDNELLRLLGVRKSSIFKPNCSILVEGVIDKRYLRHYFNIYQNLMKSEDIKFKKFREDYHFEFDQYNGSDIKHLNLEENDDSDCIFLIMDKDDGITNQDNYNLFSGILGDNCYMLECREIENLLRKEILLDVLKHESNCKNLDLSSDFSYNDYKDEKLGDFIIKTILKNQVPFNNGKMKKRICKIALKKIQKWEDLSKEAQEITKKLYDFIEINNNSNK